MTDDESWLDRLAEVAPLSVPQGPVLIVIPHPDDETLGAGALLATLSAHRVPLTVVAATDGENACDTPLEERAALGRTRTREQREALERLGVAETAIKRLHLIDSGLEAQSIELIDYLTNLVEPGWTLLAPWSGDFHPDHVACGRAAETVARNQGLRLISYFFWTWHRARPSLLDGLPLRRFEPSHEAIVAKAAALTMHRSQLERPNDEPILPHRLLAPARWPFEVFLST